jgi:malonyl-CoA/methylmalonyl-CoA synthetase
MQQPAKASVSAPLLAETFQAFREKTDHTILERYGMSETGMLVSNPLEGERLAGTVGYSLPGIDTQIRDEAGNSIEQGDIGVLQVKGANVFNGYWAKPELNQTEFEDGYFITGDMVQEAPDGRITLVGRSKDLVISGGLNIYPKEIESVLDLQPGILETAVFGVPHPDFGEGLVAAVVPEDGADLNTDDLLIACREKLAAYKSPKSIVILNELPRNSMGKVQKNRLREQHAGLFNT